MKLFILIKNATRHKCENKSKKLNYDLKKQTTRLKKIIKKFKKNNKKDDQHD